MRLRSSMEDALNNSAKMCPREAAACAGPLTSLQRPAEVRRPQALTAGPPLVAGPLLRPSALLHARRLRQHRDRPFSAACPRPAGQSPAACRTPPSGTTAAGSPPRAPKSSCGQRLRRRIRAGYEFLVSGMFGDTGYGHFDRRHPVTPARHCRHGLSEAVFLPAVGSRSLASRSSSFCSKAS